MSKIDDNTNELESYGVWVKDPDNEKTPKTEGLDLPDFDESNFSDMFNDDAPVFSEENPAATEEVKVDEPVFDEPSVVDPSEAIPADSPSDTEESSPFSIFDDDNSAAEGFADSDTTLTTDEILNIENTADITDGNDEKTQDEAPVSFEIPSETVPDEAAAEDQTALPEDSGIQTFTTENQTEIPEISVSPEVVSSESSFEEISFDDINEPALEKEEKPSVQLAPGEEEISIDDFLEDGFSDESVASGNNGYEAGKAPETAAQASAPAADSDTSGETEEISLDDFMDGASFDTEEAPKEVKAQVEDQIADEPVLDMEINFDDSSEEVQTEDNTAIDFEDSDFTADDTEETTDFTSDDAPAEAPAEEEVYVADTSNVATEDIDLSDFGISSESEETPVTQNVKEKKTEETVVDYDLAIGDEDNSQAPVVSEVVQADEKIDEVEELGNPVEEKSESVSVSLLQQIVADLSGLKDEINRLKTNLAEIKENNNSAASPSEAEEPLEPQLSEAFNSEPENSTPLSEGGFFGNDDSDDTIALTADELNNIEFEQVNTEENTSTSEEPVSAPENFTEESAASDSFEIPVVEESAPVIEETSVSEVFDTPAADDTPASEVFEAPSIEETESTEPAIEQEDNTVEIDFTEPEAAETNTTTEENTSSGENPFTEDFVVPTAGYELANEDASEPAAEENEETDNTEDNSSTEDGGFFGEDDSDETIALSGDELSNILTTSEVVEEPAVAEVTEAPDSTESEEVTDEEATLGDSSEMPFNFDENNLSEPDIDNIDLEDNGEDLPEEVSIPKNENDILVSSNQSDFMNSVHETDDENNSDKIQNGEMVDLPEEIDETVLSSPYGEEEQEITIPVEEEVDSSEIEDAFSTEIEEPSVSETSASDEVNDFAPETENSEEQEATAEQVNIPDEIETEPEVSADSVDEIAAKLDAPLEQDAAFDNVNNFMAEPAAVEESATAPEADINPEPVSEEPSVSVVEEAPVTVEETAVSIDEVQNTTSDTFPSVDSFDELGIEASNTEAASSENTEEISLSTSAETMENGPSQTASTVFDTVESLLSDTDAAATESTETTSSENTFTEAENNTSEPAPAESATAEAVTENTEENPVEAENTLNTEANFTEVDNLDSNISADNMNYLNSEEKTLSSPEEKTDNPGDLKQDIKSVLLYMDQLLENLPEDKIMEFAKSDEFVTYKKLFSELGLS